MLSNSSENKNNQSEFPNELEAAGQRIGAADSTPPPHNLTQRTMQRIATRSNQSLDAEMTALENNTEEKHTSLGKRIWREMVRSHTHPLMRLAASWAIIAVGYCVFLHQPTVFSLGEWSNNTFGDDRTEAVGKVLDNVVPESLRNHPLAYVHDVGVYEQYVRLNDVVPALKNKKKSDGKDETKNPELQKEKQNEKGVPVEQLKNETDDSAHSPYFYYNPRKYCWKSEDARREDGLPA